MSQAAKPAITGGCLCGTIRYEASAEPGSVLFCHCTMCRKATGQPVVAGAYFRADEVRFTKGNPSLYRSSPYAERGFCGSCGTPLFYHSVVPELRDRICLMLGTFDEPQRHRPTVHANVETALPFTLHDDGLPRHRSADSPFHWVRDSVPKG